MVQPTEQLDSLSKLLFNAQHRLAVASVFVASEHPLRYDDLVVSTGASWSVVHKEVGVLTRIGAVQRVEVERALYFQRAPSAFWALCDELISQTRRSAERGPLRKLASAPVEVR